MTFRIKLLQRIAQDATNTPTAGVTATTPVSGSPPAFKATDYYPGIIVAFTPRNAVLINNLADLLNQALYYNSGGKVNLSWMRSINFNFGIDNTPSLDLKNLMGFSKQVYRQLFTNNGAMDKQPLTPKEIEERLAPLKGSLFLSNLPVTNPMGQLASKIGGNIKIFINNILLQIK